MGRDQFAPCLKDQRRGQADGAHAGIWQVPGAQRRTGRVFLPKRQRYSHKHGMAVHRRSGRNTEALAVFAGCQADETGEDLAEGARVGIAGFPGDLFNRQRAELQ